MKFLIIGMGEFGQHVANALSRLENEVAIIDSDEDKINRLKDMFDSCYVADCTKINFATSDVNVKDFDACIVTVGDNFEASLIVIDKLKQAHAKRIVAKAYSDVQQKFLEMAGADDIYYPEKDSADRVARTICNYRLLDFNKISAELGVFKILVPTSWVGKKITELRVRKEENINILAIKHGEDDPTMIDVNYVFGAKDIVYVFTTEKCIKKYTR